MTYYDTTSSRRLRARKQSLYRRIDGLAFAFHDCAIEALCRDVMDAHDLHDIAAIENVIVAYENVARQCAVRDNYFDSLRHTAV